MYSRVWAAVAVAVAALAAGVNSQNYGACVTLENCATSFLSSAQSGGFTQLSALCSAFDTFVSCYDTWAPSCAGGVRCMCSACGTVSVLFWSL